MRAEKRPGLGCRALVTLGLAAAALCQPALADDNRVTLIEMGDLHGTLVPHAAVLKDPDGSERQVPSAGGLARLKTVIDYIRADNPEAVLLSAGDLTHGSAETLFTVGDAMMKPINAFGIDVFTPGNWDIPQTITVTGQDDHVADGTVAYWVITEPAAMTMTGSQSRAIMSMSCSMTKNV